MAVVKWVSPFGHSAMVILFDLFINNTKQLRKPADRLGKVVFANEVSIGGVGGGA